MIDNLIIDLKEMISETDQEGLAIKFEGKLEQIYSTQNPEIISKLIGILDDDFEFDELMFSIIHTIESFNDLIYVEKVIETFPNSILNSPRWTSIIVMRIINSPKTLDIFINQLKDLSLEKKDALSILLNSMPKRGTEIGEKVNPLLKNTTRMIERVLW